MLVDTTILIPQDPSADYAFCRQFTTNRKQASSCRVLLLRCRRESPGVVWRGLRPCLLQSTKKTAKMSLWAMFELLGLPILLPMRELDTTSLNKDQKEGDEAWRENALKRRLRLSVNPETDRTNKKQKVSQRQQLLIWIQPPPSTYFNTFFTCTMVAWEHQMIMYQSLAAWFSTLGGGHFFCRHLSTAVGLARLQRRVALLMGDYNMAYKCTINEAYSYIYAGMFEMALKTIDSVGPLNQQVDIHPLDSVIVNMCKSARLFCKRVRNASKKLASSKTQQEAMTFDDYQRIRVIQ